MVQRFSKLKSFFSPLISATDHFFRKPLIATSKPPHVRDHYDIKRMMFFVVIALIPCICMAVWNSGIQSFVYSGGDSSLYEEYILASQSISSYKAFASKYWLPIVTKGLQLFIPVVLITYLVGGFWEVLFAVIRRHEIAEGFLVTGILYALILPVTLPYWMIALGVSFGVVVGKEIFGGTGRNLLNPALTSRCFLYFAFPAYMTGAVWVGPTSYEVEKSVQKIASFTQTQGITQASALSFFNLPHSVKKIHVDTYKRVTMEKFAKGDVIDSLVINNTPKQIDNSVEAVNSLLTAPPSEGGLGLSQDLLPQVKGYAALEEGSGLFSNANLFFGNRIGSIGEISIFAILLGALFLLLTGIASIQTMSGFAIGMFGAALLFNLIAYFSPHHGLFLPATFAFPAYKHFLLGGAAFGLVFMATDPVSSPGLPRARFVYGLFIGFLVIIIRVLNPAYPEGVMLAILLGNVFAPLFDHFAIKQLRKKRLYAS
jgi:Na+-transporting NADH:ubiquinone oxidoreductase subunit B